MDNLLGWLAIGGAALLAALIAFAMIRQRRVSRAQHMAGERATRELYASAERNQKLDTK